MNFKKQINTSLKQTWSGFKNMFPILIGMLLLISLLITVGVEKVFKWFFSGVDFLDAFIGGVLGSIAVGNPITSYIVGGELLSEGISFVAVVAFIVAWVTVGVVQLPAEALMIGKRFAFTRNVVSFFAAIFVAVLTSYTLSFFR